MQSKIIILSLATAFCLAGCSSDTDVPKTSEGDKKPAAEQPASTKSKAAGFMDAINNKLDTTRIKSDKSDMYRFKNDEMTIFHKTRRSDDLLEKNESLDPSYYK